VINDVIDKTQRCLSLLLKGPPDLWNRPAFDDIRSSINTIVANPEKYPLSPGGWGESRDCLTKEVANRLKSRSMEADCECGTDKNAIYLQISSSTCMTKPNTIGINGSTTDITRQVWKFNALDGDNNPLIFRIDSTLNAKAMSLATGTIAKVTTYFPVYFNYDNQNDTRCAIVARSFEVVGRQHLPPGISTSVGNNGKAIKVKPEKKPRPKKRKESPSSTTQQATPPTCNGNLCSKHGVAFGLCLAALIPPNFVCV